MMKEFNVRIRTKTDTEQNFTTSNPLLLDGEVAVVLRNDGSYSLKVGRENTHFNDLPYMDATWRGITGYNTWVGSQAEFDAIQSKDNNTLYFVFNVTT